MIQFGDKKVTLTLNHLATASIFRQHSLIFRGGVTSKSPKLPPSLQGSVCLPNKQIRSPHLPRWEATGTTTRSEGLGTPTIWKQQKKSSEPANERQADYFNGKCSTLTGCCSCCTFARHLVQTDHPLLISLSTSQRTKVLFLHSWNFIIHKSQRSQDQPSAWCLFGPLVLWDFRVPIKNPNPFIGRSHKKPNHQLEPLPSIH